MLITGDEFWECPKCGAYNMCEKSTSCVNRCRPKHTDDCFKNINPEVNFSTSKDDSMFNLL